MRTFADGLLRYQKATSAHQAAGGGGGGAGSPIASSSSSSSIASKPKPTDKWAKYSTAASLGFIDKSEIEANKLAELNNERTKQGLASEWQTVQVITPQAAEAEEDPTIPNHHTSEAGGSISRLTGSLDHDPQEEARSFALNASSSTTSSAPSKARRRFDAGKYDDFEDGFDPDEILRKANRARASAADGMEDGRDGKSKLNKEEESKGGLDRSSWQGLIIGKTEDQGDSQPPKVKQEANATADSVKQEIKPDPTDAAANAINDENAQGGDTTVDPPKPATTGEASTSSTTSGGPSLFKKRRAPPAGSRSVRQKT